MSRRTNLALFTLMLAVGFSPVLAADIPGNASSDAKLPVTGLSTAFKKGQFEFIGDSDWYKIILSKGKDYAIAADELTKSFGELQFRLRNKNGKILITGSDDPEFGANGFEFRSNRTGKFYLEIKQIGVFQEPFGYEIKAATDCRKSVTTLCGLEIGQTRRGVSAFVFDEDWYKVLLAVGKTYNFAVKNITFPDALSVILYNAAGEKVAEAPHVEGTQIIEYEPSVGGNHFIAVSSINDEVDATLFEVKATAP